MPVAELGRFARELHHAQSSAPGEVRRTEACRLAFVTDRLVGRRCEVGRCDPGRVLEDDERGVEDETGENGATQPCTHA